MKTDAQRIARYNARMQSSLIDPTLSQINTLAKANFAAYENDFYPKQLQLRALLDGYGIPTVDYVTYEAYNGELYHLSKVASGDSAIAMGSIIELKYQTWLGIGAAANLKEIAVSIYGIVIP
jgi:hypothetical protein